MPSTDPAIRTELAAARATRSDLLLQAIRLDQAFLAQSPKDPLADEASLALVGAFLDLEDFASVVRLSRRFAELYPKSTFQDSFQYSEALGRFHLGEYDRAIAVAETIATATYKDASGVDQPSPNKWQAVYILGQIYDARREPAQALAYYERVAERFSDAAGAVKALTRKELKLPEVSVIRPDAPGSPRPAAGSAACPSKADDEPKDEKAAKLDYRNIATADVKVYPVDLMRLYLTRRNLDAIAGIDLAGIKPFHEATIKLGDGKDFDDKTRAIDFPVKKEGAYLVMVRGDDRYASGILLVSPAGAAGARGTRERPRPRDRARRPHQGVRAEGPGQGDRLRATPRSSRARPTCGASSWPRASAARSRPWRGRTPTSTPSTAARPSSARPRPPRTPRARASRSKERRSRPISGRTSGA